MSISIIFYNWSNKLVTSNIWLLRRLNLSWRFYKIKSYNYFVEYNCSMLLYNFYLYNYNLTHFWIIRITPPSLFQRTKFSYPKGSNFYRVPSLQGPSSLDPIQPNLKQESIILVFQSPYLLLNIFWNV